MLLLPVQTSPTSYTLFIVLEDTNLERLREHDPAQVELSKMTPPWPSLHLDDFVIAYAAVEEVKLFKELVQADRVGDAVGMLSRGFRFRPDKGDHESGYVSIKKGKS
jgi:hypothetical protein